MLHSQDYMLMNSFIFTIMIIIISILSSIYFIAV